MQNTVVVDATCIAEDRELESSISTCFTPLNLDKFGIQDVR